MGLLGCGATCLFYHCRNFSCSYSELEFAHNPMTQKKTLLWVGEVEVVYLAGMVEMAVKVM